ncbi:MAG TPA: FKBP-type peptidyl-prolyl cis-trans isomerase [Streptosporangiaceae bacterium]|jgi:FKBP-type peptidyl-prolyl cis-trans isomerase|nr:FKBP-type peptidyl-prolyl cis-trans isomerase [Streptosporangiaceae bacterium]
MRRISAALLVPLLAGLALVGCGSSSSSSSDPNAGVSVSGAFGKAPVVKIPASKAGAKLDVTTAIKGTGAVVPSGDNVLANLAIYKWSGKTHKLLESTFTAFPAVVPAEIGLKGLASAIKGQKVGTRILAVLPPKYGYGTTGNTNLGVTKSDTTVWVIDLIKPFAPTASATGKTVSSGGGALPAVKQAGAGTAPVITVPKGATPPKALTVKTLIQGTGPVIGSKDTVVAQYVASIWRTGAVFNTTWPSSSSAGLPFSFAMGSNGVIPGFQKGLTGVKVGSRVMITIPPSLGYGSAGQSSVGIKGTDTLVFVVDVLASVPGNS